METSSLASLYQATGPFATVLVDVSRDSENAAHEHELRVRSAGEALTGQGADETVVKLDPADHPGLAVGAATAEGPLPAVQALIAAAVLTGTKVSVTPGSTMGGSPVVALLRWDQDAVGPDRR